MPKVHNRKDLEKVKVVEYYSFPFYDSVDVTKHEIFLPLDQIEDKFLRNAVVWNPIGISNNYVFKETNVHPIYSAKYKLKIEEEKPNQTIVTVAAIDPEIAIGSKVTAHDVHNFGMREAIMIPAEPSTIEEYQILLRIGKALGVQEQMPKLILKNYK